MGSLTTTLHKILTEDRADDVIVSDSKQALTGISLVATACHIANSWRKRDVPPGSRIAVSVPHRLSFLVYYFAAMYGGYTIVPINPNLAQTERDKLLNVANPNILISEPAPFLASGPCYDIKTTPQQTFAIFLTSGSTGKPKGVCHGLETMLANVEAFNLIARITECTHMLHVMPIYYMAGFLNTILSPLLAGGRVFLDQQFDAKKALHFWHAARSQGVNTVWISPSMAYAVARLCRDETLAEWVHHAMTHVFVGTAPLSERIHQQFFETFGVRCKESYGMTEILLASVNTEGQSVGAGTFLANISYKINGDNELLLQSPYSMQGYFDCSNDLSECKPQKWFATGDFAVVEDNFLHITGRKKDLIIKGGVNHSPLHIETILNTHPSVIESAVIGKPHDFWGEEIIAFVTPVLNARINAQDILQFCAKRLDAAALPSQIEFRDSFPKSETGKILKSQLRAQL